MTNPFSTAWRAIEAARDKSSYDELVQEPINPGEYIKKPIKETVEEILRENDIAKNEGNFNITLVPEGIEGKRISNYLNDGKLQITMQGAYYAYFEDIFKTKSKIIDDKKQRTERIIEQAQIRALEKSMENEPKGDT